MTPLLARGLRLISAIPFSWKLLAFVLAAAAVAVTYYRLQANHYRQLSIDNWFAAANAEALADATRSLADRNGVLASIRAQGFAIVQRQVVQQLQRGDSLDRALQLERTSVANLTVQVQALEVRIASAEPVVQTPVGARSASFVIDEVPFRGSVNVELPAAPARGSMDLSLHVDPATVDIRHSCEKADGQGLRRGQFTVTGPAWLTVGIGRVEQDPGTCNQAKLEERPPPFMSKIYHTARDVSAVAGALWGLHKVLEYVGVIGR